MNANRLLCASLYVAGLVIITANHAESSSYCCDNDHAYSKTAFSARPQGNYVFVNLLPTADITHRPDNKKNYLDCTLSLGYRHNMDNYELGRYFFTQVGPVIIGATNTSVDIQNLQLGLANNYKGSVVMLPTVSDFLADLDFYAGFDKWVKGGWIRLHLPFVRNAWQACLQSGTSAVGSNRYPAGFADTSTAIVGTIYQNGGDAMCGDTAFGKIPALSAGKLCCKTNTCWGLSDVHLEFGYDFLRRHRGNLGVAIIAAIGTGRPTGASCHQYILTPTIGTQHSSQCGVALRGQYQLLNFDNTKTVTLYGDARVEHIFAGCTQRLLNLTAGGSTAFNYWLLLNEYNQAGTYEGVERAANLLNKKVKVSAAAMGEATVMALTCKDQWRWALGYNFWWRSRENITVNDLTISGNNTYYTLKDPGTWGTNLIEKAQGNIAQEPANAIKSATLARIKDNAFYSGDIDVCSAQAPATYSNTFFASIGYHFKDHRCAPFIMLSGNAEWGRGNTALSTWGLYMQGGIAI